MNNSKFPVNFHFPIGKKGEKISIFWWFIVCTIVFLVIVFVTAGFFGKPVDVREVQTKINYLNFYDCIISHGFLEKSILDSKFSVDECGFSDTSMKNNFGYLEANITSRDGKVIAFFNVGDSSLAGDCSVIQGSSVAKNYPICYWKNESFYYFIKGERKIGNVRILSASNNHGERISTLNFGDKNE